MKRIEILLEYLGVLLVAGANLLDAVHVVFEIRKDKSWRSFIRKIESALDEGKSFSDALRSAEPDFPNRFASQLRVSEETGTLGQTCEEIAKRIHEESERSAEWQRVMLYPAFVVFAGLASAWMMGNFVLPSFQELYASLGMQMPAWTRVLGIALRTGPIVLIGGSIATWLLFRIFGRKLKDRVERIAFTLPWVGNVVARRFFRGTLSNLSLLLNAHISLQKSLRMELLESRPAFRPTLFRLRQRVSAGSSLSAAAHAQKLADGWVVAMMKLGEETGELPKMLAHVCDRLDQEERRTIKTMIALAEPGLVAATGLGVGLFVFLVVGPLFDLLTQATW